MQLALLIALCADLEVTVLDDASGRPLRNAQVTATPVKGDPAILETGPDGRAALTEGEYRLSISKPSYNTVIATVTKSLTIRLIRLGVITGQVSDAQSGAMIVAFNQGRVASVAKVDNQGRYRLFDLGPGTYTVARIGDGAPQLYRVTFTITGADEHTGIDFIPTRIEGQTVTGQVTNAGKPTRAQLSLATTTPPFLTVLRTQSDDAGRYRFDNVPTGTYELLATVFDTRPLFGRTAIDVGTAKLEADIGVSAGSTASLQIKSQSTDCPVTGTLTLAPAEAWALSLPTRGALAPLLTMTGLVPGWLNASIDGHPPNCYPKPIPPIDSRSSAVTTISFTKAAELKVKVPPGRIALLISPDAPMKLAIDDFTFTGVRPGKHWIITAPANERWFGNQPKEINLLPGANP